MNEGQNGERERLMQRVVETERQLQKLLMADRSNPFLSLDHLTIQQLKVLLVLSFPGGRGRASGRELSEALGVGLATVSGIVDRLAAQGLVERRDGAEDRRVRYVFITESGERITEKLISAGQTRRERFLKRLDVEDLRRLDDVTSKLLNAAEKEAEHEQVVSRVARSG